MADCNSLESLMTTLTNEVAALKTKVANLESKQHDYATKSELANAIAEVRRFAEKLVGELRRVMEAAINALRDIINGLFGNNNGLEQRVQNLEIRVGGLDGITASIMRALQSAQGRVDRLESVVNGIKEQVGQILGRISGLENIQGQILMDIRNIYSSLSQYKRDIDYVKGQIIAIWAAIAAAAAAAAAALLAAIAGVKALIAVITKQIAAIYGQIGLIWAAIRALQLRPPILPPSGGVRNGRDGRDGLNGRDGKDGLNGKNGRDGLNGRNGLNGKDAEVKLTTINIPVFDGCKSDGSGAKFKTEAVQVIEGLEGQVYKEFDRISKIEAAKCEIKSAIAILPEHHQIKSGSNIPQLSILWREVKPDGKLGDRFRASTIPHYASGRTPVLSNYKKGSHYARIVLKDNSCITVYAFSQPIAETVAREQLNYVSASLKPNPVKVSLGQRKGEELEEFTVKAVRISYFPSGVKNTQPEWVNEL